MPNIDYGYIESILKQTEEGGSAKGWDYPFWRHLHWGLYQNPNPPEHTLGVYYAATERMTAHVVEAAQLDDGNRVLDVGCGLGGTLDYIRERNPKCALAGINIDERQVRRATELVGGDGTTVTRISFVTGDGCRLPVADRSVDHLLAIECLFHFPSRKQFFKEAARILRPGGTLALSDFMVSPGFLSRALQRSKGARNNFQERLVSDALKVSQDFNSFLDERATPQDPWFGASRRPLTPAGYERLGRGAGFDLLVDDDVTERTLPTYEAHRLLYEAGVAWGLIIDDRASQEGLASGQLMAEAARQGDWQYHVLSFRRRTS